MSEDEHIFYERLVDRYHDDIVEQFGKVTEENKVDIIAYIAQRMTDAERYDAVSLMYENREPLRLKNFHIFMEKREGKPFKLKPFEPRHSELNMWLGIIHGAYMQKLVTVSEAETLLLELASHGLDSEPFHQLVDWYAAEKANIRAEEAGEAENVSWKSINFKKGGENDG